MYGELVKLLFLNKEGRTPPTVVLSMGRRPLTAVRDFTGDGRWSAYDASVRENLGGGGGGWYNQQKV
jgi:hypothetical protein